MIDFITEDIFFKLCFFFFQVFEKVSQVYIQLSFRELSSILLRLFLKAFLYSNSFLPKVIDSAVLCSSLSSIYNLPILRLDFQSFV